MTPPSPGRAAGEDALRITILIVILVHAAGTFAYLALWRTITDPAFDVNDFKAYYTGALALSEGRRDLLYPDASTLNLGVLPDQPWVRYAVERGVPHPSGYIYPPFLAVLLRPLTVLDYHRANQVWFALNVLLFAATVAALVTLRPGRPDPISAGVTILVSLCFYPTLRAFQCGQVSLAMLFLLASALWFLERGKDTAAGVLVALGAAVKLTPAILILFFIAARRYRAAVASIVAGAAAIVVSVAGAGWENHVVFVRDFLPALSRGAATFANQSLAGTLDRIFLDQTMNSFVFVAEPGWLTVVNRAASISILLASLLLARKIAAGGADPAPGYSLVVLASLIASPISWEHHFVLALIPIAVLTRRMVAGGEATLPGALLLASGWALLGANAYDLIRHHFPYALGRVAVSYAFAGSVLLAALLVMRAVGMRSAAPERSSLPETEPAGALR